jgi:hypothetical protein
MVGAIQRELLHNPNNVVQVGLFTNNVTPTVTSVAGDFYPPGWVGYLPQTAKWGLPYLNPAGVGEIDAQPLTWTVAYGGFEAFNVYGYFLYDAYQSLVWAEAFEGGPQAVVAGGQQIELDLAFTMSFAADMLRGENMGKVVIAAKKLLASSRKPAAKTGGRR